jgi:DNA-binding NtrC family response regulator
MADDRPVDPTLTMATPIAAAAPLAAVVRVLDEGGRTFRLSTGTCVLGSDPSCDLVVAHPTVSREHVELELAPQGVVVRDLQSRNGTFFLGQRVGRLTVGLGSRLQLGKAHVAIEPDTDALYGDLAYGSDSYQGMVGHSFAMRRVFALLQRLEGSLATVLVEGESGVGKELVARAIHAASRIADGPFVALNCGAVSRDLVGSELFGHQRGAFSGAVGERKGVFQRADGGTLFLDEIGELPLDLQPMLLRALENGEIQPLGADTTVKVNIRLVAATHRVLERSVEEGRFRQDLYYRLAVVRIAIPPLRERLDDVEPLAQDFARQAGAQDALPPDIIERLKAQPWTGNARELRNAVEAYLAIGVVPGDIPPADRVSLTGGIDTFVDTTKPYIAQRDALVDAFSRRYLEELLRECDDNQSEAARRAQIDRKYFLKLLARYGLR